MMAGTELILSNREWLKTRLLEVATHEISLPAKKRRRLANAYIRAANKAAAALNPNYSILIGDPFNSQAEPDQSDRSVAFGSTPSSADVNTNAWPGDWGLPGIQASKSIQDHKPTYQKSPGQFLPSSSTSGLSKKPLDLDYANILRKVPQGAFLFRISNSDFPIDKSDSDSRRFTSELTTPNSLPKEYFDRFSSLRVTKPLEHPSATPEPSGKLEDSATPEPSSGDTSEIDDFMSKTPKPSSLGISNESDYLTRTPTPPSLEVSDAFDHFTMSKPGSLDASDYASDVQSTLPRSTPLDTLIKQFTDFEESVPGPKDHKKTLETKPKGCNSDSAYDCTRNPLQMREAKSDSVAPLVLNPSKLSFWLDE
eukprot:Gregarina_sp_Poly_1__11221@NODE_922_length_5705_cov_244_146683_g655_i0_p3_GENE_NODE_922_length_5705_cov_244_146683_g655_i0NODE_922_length_5705_cov_244_146683_g655_i0_p3_ORF_typecomplete_len367_score55_83_NODE_922_length_5705_cov_244_146683_g655_i042265326